MSKVITHTREKITEIKKGHNVRTEHNHNPQGKSGYIPQGTGQNPYKNRKQYTS